jgi:hypothetical protein
VNHVTFGVNARAKVMNSLQRETRTVGVLVDFWYRRESHEATIYIALSRRMPFVGTGLIFSARQLFRVKAA